MWVLLWWQWHVCAKVYFVWGNYDSDISLYVLERLIVHQSGFSVCIHVCPLYDSCVGGSLIISIFCLTESTLNTLLTSCIGCRWTPTRIRYQLKIFKAYLVSQSAMCLQYRDSWETQHLAQKMCEMFTPTINVLLGNTSLTISIWVCYISVVRCYFKSSIGQSCAMEGWAHAATFHHSASPSVPLLSSDKVKTGGGIKWKRGGDELTVVRPCLLHHNQKSNSTVDGIISVISDVAQTYITP